MHKRTIEGYVLDVYYQGLEKSAHVSFALFLGYTGWMFYCAITQVNGYVVFWCIGIVFMALAAWVAMNHRSIHNIYYLRFSICGEELSNKIGDKVVSIQMEGPVFCTQATLEIGLAKTTTYEKFYVFVSKPTPALRECDKSGLKPIEKLINAGAVVLPVREEVTNWITERFGVETIAEYPKVMYFPVKQADEWEYTEW